MVRLVIQSPAPASGLSSHPSFTHGALRIDRADLMRLPWVAVSFAATPDAWVLTVEDSGVGLPRGTPTGAGLRVAGALTALLGGELVFADVVAGTRCTVTLPRRWSSAVPNAGPVPANRERAG